MSRTTATSFKVLLIDDDQAMNTLLKRLLEGHRMYAAGVTFVPEVEAVNVELVRYKGSHWRIAEATFAGLDRASGRAHDLIMVDFAFADAEAKDFLWGKDRSRVPTKEEAKGRLLTLRDLAELYAERLGKRSASARNIFLDARRVVMRSMVPNLDFDFLGPVFPNRFNEARAAFPNAQVMAVDPRNEIYAGDTFYNFYDCPRGREFYRQLIGGHYLRIVEVCLLRAIMDAAEIHGAVPSPLLGSRSDWTVFLSYSNADSLRAQDIYSRLLGKGFSVYLADHALSGGDHFSDEIRLALRQTKEVWVLLTPESLKSEWVLTEWGAAWTLGKRIVPILYRCGPHQLPDRLRVLQCVDYDRVDSLIADLALRLSEFGGS